MILVSPTLYLLVLLLLTAYDIVFKESFTKNLGALWQVLSLSKLPSVKSLLVKLAIFLPLSNITIQVPLDAFI